MDDSAQTTFFTGTSRNTASLLVYVLACDALILIA